MPLEGLVPTLLLRDSAFRRVGSNFSEIPSEGLVPTSQRYLQKVSLEGLVLTSLPLRACDWVFAPQMLVLMMPLEGLVPTLLLRDTFRRAGSHFTPAASLRFGLCSSNVGSHDALGRVGSNFAPPIGYYYTPKGLVPTLLHRAGSYFPPQRCLQKGWFQLLRDTFRRVGSHFGP